MKKEIQKKFIEAKKEIQDLGGWKGFKEGEWFLRLTHKVFRNYYERANCDFLREKYPGIDNAALVKRLTALAARNAAILGGIVGAAISADEIVALVTVGEMGIGLPANITVGLSALAAEMILLTRIQLQLVANIARCTGVPLDPDDPEDILIIFGFAVGGSASEIAGKAGMKMGSHLSRAVIKGTIKKETLKKVQAIARKVGIKLLQRTIIKYAAPGVSIGIGATWNYLATRAIAKIAIRHFDERMNMRKVRSRPSQRTKRISGQRKRR
jgi:uncharacterized protein (DUF697 family)